MAAPVSQLEQTMISGMDYCAFYRVIISTGGSQDEGKGIYKGAICFERLCSESSPDARPAQTMDFAILSGDIE